MPGTVAVLGGGVAGLSAAHELAERGFAVTVYESARAPAARRAATGRRARDRRARGPAGRARLPLLPGLLPPPARHDERGSRPATGRHVLDELVAARRGSCSRRPGRERARRPRARCPSRSTTSPCSRASCSPRRPSSASPADDQALFVERLLTLLTSCDERRFGEWELQSWWEFVDGRAPLRRLPEVPRRRPDAHARRRAGARDERAHGRLHPAPAALRPLARGRRAPTACSTRRPARSWIDPWVAHLRGRGVDLRLGAPRRGRSTARTGGSRGVTVERRRGASGHRRPLRRGAAGRGHARTLAQPGAERRRAAPGRPRPAGHALDERHPCSTSTATSRSSTATRSTSTPSGR